MSEELEDEDIDADSVKDITLTIRARIRRGYKNQFGLSVDYEAHPDVLFIGGHSSPVYEEGDEIKERDYYTNQLRRWTNNKRPIHVKFELIDERQKQSGLESFM